MAFKPLARDHLRYLVYALSLLLSLLLAGLAWRQPGYLWLLAVTGPLVLFGTHDLFQTRHNLLRNYPLTAHLRWLFESIRPEIRQYLFESDTEATPFSRAQRSLVYSRAKLENDRSPFGTKLDTYAEGYEWFNHSIAARPGATQPFRVNIGGSQCSVPYSASVFNISAMSFGALSGNAIRALNKGAVRGGFYHDTGEGGISRYHREFGGDLVWEIGSGYFGCRDAQGGFDAGLFADQATDPQIKMIELKLSQGAKPGHGGVLPAAKVSPEIAAARGVPPWTECISPAAHPEFSTPIGMLEFLARLRELSGGKPTGLKLCVGQGWEVMAICKAMLETGILPDFFVVDGAEGGTGAAPLELTNHVGVPLREGLVFVHNALVGIDVRDQVRVAAAGKITSGIKIATNLALGADWCNAARGFMFALGCVQSLSCHTDRCPTGVATQHPLRQRAVVVSDKSERVYHFHRQTVLALGQVVASLGLDEPDDLRPDHLSRRVSDAEVKTMDRIYPYLQPGELIAGSEHEIYRENWHRARSDSFHAATGTGPP